MYRPDEKDIDRLSREAAEHYHAPGKPSWDALQQVLDKELPQEKEKKRRGFLFFFLILLGLSLTGSMIWYGVKMNNKDKTVIVSDKNNPGSKTAKTTGAHNIIQESSSTKPTNTPAVAVTANNSTSATDIKANTEHIKSKNKTETIAPLVQDEATSSTEKKTVKPAITSASKINVAQKNNVPTAREADNSTIKEKTGNIVPLNKKPAYTTVITNSAVIPPGKKYKNTGSKNKTFTSIATSGSSQTSTTGNNDVADDNKQSTDNTKNDVTAVQKTEPVVVTSTTDTVLTKAPVAKPAVTAQPAAKKDSAVAVKKKIKSKPERAINFGLVAGIDESTVKFTHGDNAGYNIGLVGGYQFSKHWSVYTGAIYTKKNYNLNGKDFHPPHPYFTLYVDLQNVEGYCKMWEIPLQARYTFNPGTKTPFFASAGLSSYIMTKQYYNYSWKSSTGWPMTGAWDTDSTFRHVLSILSLSAGFEKSIGKHMNLQVEPYAKIPLGGVGFGDIKLSSFGINFSVQYRHPVKR